MIRGLLFDIDGTVRKHNIPILGAVKCLNNLQIPYCFLSNTPDRTGEVVSRELREIGFNCSAQQVVTCLEATISYLKPGSVYAIGSEILKSLLTQSGFVLTEVSPDYVIVSYDTECTYLMIEKASQLIRGGAQYIATNPDKICFTQRGISPGTGAIVAAVSAAAGSEPLVIGKPNRFIVDVGLERLNVPRDQVLLIGDYLEIDVQAGINAGIPTALILTGASTRKDVEQSALKPNWILEDFSDFDRLIGK